MSNPVRLSVTALVLVSMLLPLAGCGDSTSPDPVTPAATDGTGSVLEGATLVDSLCTKCHTRDRIDQANKDLVGWQTTIDRMITKNKAQITAEQQTAIAIYLSNR